MSEEPPILIDLSARERRFYERIRDRWVDGASWAPAPGAPRSSPGDWAFLLPDLVVLLFRLLRDPRVPLKSKAVALGGLGYILSPIDLLPEFIFGPFGLLDDLLVVAAALSRIVNDVHPDLVRHHWPGRGDALGAVQELTDWADRLVTRRLPRFVRQLLGG